MRLNKKFVFFVIVCLLYFTGFYGMIADLFISTFNWFFNLIGASFLFQNPLV